MAISADEAMIAAGDGEGFVYLWDAETGEPLGDPLPAGEERITALQFSPRGDLLASGNSVGVTLLWDLETNRRVGGELTRGTGTILSLVFSPDGRLLVGAGFDGLVLWDLRERRLSESACEIAARNLSRSEWRRYVGEDVPYRATCPGLPAPPG